MDAIFFFLFCLSIYWLKFNKKYYFIIILNGRDLFFFLFCLSIYWLKFNKDITLLLFWMDAIFFFILSVNLLAEVW